MFPIGLDELPGHDRHPRSAPTGSRVGGYSVESAPVPHVGETLGYRVTHRATSVAYISDHQQPRRWHARSTRRVWGLCQGVDLLIHDAQYTPDEFKRKRDWGHCTVEYAVWLAGEVGAKRLALFHHDPDARRRHDRRLDGLRGAVRQASSASRCSPPPRA